MFRCYLCDSLNTKFRIINEPNRLLCPHCVWDPRNKDLKTEKNPDWQEWD